MYSRIFEVSDEDTYMLVCRTIGELLNDGEAPSELVETPASTFLAECRRHQSDDNTVGMLEMFTSKVDLLFDKASDKDAESCVQIMSHYISRLHHGDSGKPIEALATALELNTKQHPEARLRSLLHLYNAATYPEDQYRILLKAVRYAARTGLADVLAPVIKGKAGQFVRSWNLPTPQARQLYLDFAGLLRTCRIVQGAGKESLELITKALLLAEASDLASLQAAGPHAAEAIRGFVRLPGVYTCDLASLPAVRNLANDSKLAPLYNFFMAMVSGDIRSLEKFATPEVMKELEVNLSYCQDKMRMAAVLSLSREFSRQAIPYSKLEEVLGVGAYEVETWIVKAIGEGLIDGRIDQLRNLVTFTRSTTKHFTESDWKDLELQFVNWKKMLGNVEGMLSEANPADLARGMIHH